MVKGGLNPALRRSYDPTLEKTGLFCGQWRWCQTRCICDTRCIGKGIQVSRNRWHILRDGESLTMTRALPVRFDVSAETTLPDGSRQRLARQIRQDLWRRLQHLRGFSPIVRVIRDGAVCRITAGGRVEGRFARGHTEDSIAAMLNDRHLRARWSAYAAHEEVPGHA